MISRGTALAVAALLLAAPGRASAGDYESLGSLERESVDEALAARGLTLEPAPAGKTIGRVHVVNQEVFSSRDWLFQFFNHFHRTTREDIIVRELLVRPGQAYDQSLVEESIRNLQSSPEMALTPGRTFPGPELSSVVVILPVRSAETGTVDLLVVTRDVWSLRFNTNFEFQENALVYLATSLSENNLLGWRKYLSAGLTMNQGAVGVGPTYFDPNIAGTRLMTIAAATVWYNRTTEREEGDSEEWALRYPLFSLASRWSAGVDIVHDNTVQRSYLGNELRQVDVGVGSARYVFRRSAVTLDTNVVRSWQGRLIHRLSAGYLLDRRRYSFTDEFDSEDPLLRQAFVDRFLPVPELRSAPYVGYETFTPVYRVYRNLNTFDLREDRRIGPWASARLSLGLPELGSDFRFLSFSVNAVWTADLLGGFQSVSVGASGRWRDDGSFIDQAYSTGVYAAGPVLFGALRVVGGATLAMYRGDTQRRLYVVGGQTGLRGYMIGEFQGPVEAIGHIELRSMPLHVWSQRVGALLFWDIGHATGRVGALHAYNDVGVGLRWLIPQLNSSVLRIDWAFALQDAPQLNANTIHTHAGWPGRLSAGFLQAF